MDGMTLLWMSATCALLCYLYYVSHSVVVHNCAHNSLFRRRWANRLVGNVICTIHMTYFEGWRVAHMLHHRFANTPHDPHHIDRPLIPYMFTHYFRIVKALGQPTRPLKAILPPIFVAIGIIIWQAVSGNALRGVAWVCFFWLIPVLFSHLAIAHFNYITHVGLPVGRGKDTHNLHRGIWRVINFFMFNLYLHAEHHMRPSEPIPRFVPNAIPLQRGKPAVGDDAEQKEAA